MNRIFGKTRRRNFGSFKNELVRESKSLSMTEINSTVPVAVDGKAPRLTCNKIVAETE